MPEAIPAELDAVSLSVPIAETAPVQPAEPAQMESVFAVSGFADCPSAEIHLTGYFGSKVAQVTKADSKGFYSFSGIPQGGYIVRPSAPEPGKTFLPEFRAVVVVDADLIGIDFIDPSSVVDSRNFGNFPNLSTNVQGTLTYTKPKVDSRAAGAPVDSRAAGAPVDSRVSSPQNSRA